MRHWKFEISYAQRLNINVKDRVATEANGWPGPRVIVDEADEDT